MTQLHVRLGLQLMIAVRQGVSHWRKPKEKLHNKLVLFHCLLNTGINLSSFSITTSFTPDACIQMGSADFHGMLTTPVRLIV